MDRMDKAPTQNGGRIDFFDGCACLPRVCGEFSSLQKDKRTHSYSTFVYECDLRRAGRLASRAPRTRARMSLRMGQPAVMKGTLHHQLYSQITWRFTTYSSAL